MKDAHFCSMAACVENSSLFLVVDMPKVKLEVIAETEEGDETSLLSSVLEKGCTNSNGGTESGEKGISDSGAVKVRNNLTHKKSRKLPSLSFSPSPAGSTEEQRIQKSQPVRRVVTSPKVLSTHGDHSVIPLSPTENKTSTHKSSQERLSFQKKKQLFEQGEGALLARRALSRRLPTRRNGRQKLPKVPDQSMDPIDQVLEANRVQTLPDVDLNASENNTLVISSHKSSTGTVENKDIKIDHTDESNAHFALSGSEQTTKEATSVGVHKYTEISHEVKEDILKALNLLQVNSLTSFMHVSSDNNAACTDGPTLELPYCFTSLDEIAENLHKQTGDYQEDNFPEEVCHTIVTDSSIQQQAQKSEDFSKCFTDNNNINYLDLSSSQLDFDRNCGRQFSEVVTFDESGMGDDLEQKTAKTSATVENTEITRTEEEDENKPLQDFDDLIVENIHMSDKNLSLDDRKHPSEMSGLDSQLTDLKVSNDTLNLSKSDRELTESPRGDKQLFKLLLDDYEDDFNTDDEQDSGEQLNINNISEIEDKQKGIAHVQRKLARNDAIDDDADMTAKSSAKDGEMETTLIKSRETRQESKKNEIVNEEQLGLHSDVDISGGPKSEMEFNSKNDEADGKNEIKVNSGTQQDGDGSKTYRRDGDSKVDSRKNYQEHSSEIDNEKELLGSQEILDQSKNVDRNLINSNTSSQLKDENNISTSNLQAKQNNGDVMQQGKMMSENTEIRDFMKSDIIIYSKTPPAGENSPVTQYAQNDVSGNAMKLSTDEKIAHSLNPVVVLNEDNDDVTINGGGDIDWKKDSHNQSNVFMNENKSHQIISSQDAPNSELEANILHKEQESVSLGEEPSSEQTSESIKSLGNYEHQLGDEINDLHHGTTNETDVTAVDQHSSLIQEPLLGKNHPSSQKLIKGNEREETEGMMIRRQMGEQQSNQREKSDENLSHSLPGDVDNRQARDLTYVVNDQQEATSNAIANGNRQLVTMNHEDKSNHRKYDGHKIKDPEHNNGTNMEPGSNGEMISQPFERGLLNESVEHGISQDETELRPARVAASENVTHYQNPAHVAVGTKKYPMENKRKTENLLQENQHAMKVDGANFGISIQGHQMPNKVSHSNNTSNGIKESVQQKSAVKVQQTPTVNDNIQTFEGVGILDIINEGPVLTNIVHDKNGNRHEASMNSNLPCGAIDKQIIKENVSRFSNKEGTATESLPKESALKVRQVPTVHNENVEAVRDDNVTEGHIVRNDYASGTNEDMPELPQHYSNPSGGQEENKTVPKAITENSQKQPVKANGSVQRKSALKVQQVPTGNDTQSSTAVRNCGMVNENLIAMNHNTNGTNGGVQESLKHSDISSGPGKDINTKQNGRNGNTDGSKESTAKIKIYPVRHDQAGIRVMKVDGTYVQPQRHPHVDQKEGKEKGANRHEGHNCPRELRRLAKLKAAEENALAESQNTSSLQAPDETRSRLDGAAASMENPPFTSKQAFPGQGSEEAANSELIQTPASPSSKKKRRKKPADPLDGLPPIKPWHLHQMEMNAEIMERPKKKKKGHRRFNISQFDDPFHQMIWVLFRAADRDNNNKLNKKELSLIFNSPKLQLSLTQDDIKRLLKESSTEEEADPKTCELSFEEFIPLGRLILMLYYSKTDESSQSKWCILDKGQDYGIIYFNKLTGDASLSVPTDYYADVLHEPDLLDIAIHDLFEDADLNNDGMINLTDFLRILRSEDFGLFLTNGDVEEIMKYFVNMRGKEMLVQFEEFVPLAKRLILTVYRARDRTPHEWCHLYTKNVGSFWFNKRTGQADRHPPTSLVRTLQDLLEHRSREIEVFMEVAEELHHTKEALQIETEKRQKLEEELAELSKNHETTCKELAKTCTNLEKSKEEVEQKSKQIRYFEKEKIKQQSVIESLQDRAEEADRIEANLESLRNVLQNTQTSVREKEFDVRDLTNTLEETKKELASTKQHSASLQDKIDDLVTQLRDEIRRNERVEKELERTKSYKFEKVEVEDILKETKDELELRMNQLTHARYEIRDNKSRIRRIETELNNVPDFKKQLEEKEEEIKTLKEKIEKLETQMIEDARLAEKYPRELVRRRRWNKARSIETPDKSHDCSDPNCPVNGRTSASCSAMWAYRNNGETQTHPNGSFLELLSNMEGEDDSDSLNIYDFYEPHYPEVSPHRMKIDTAGHRERSRLVRPKSSAGRLETKKQSKLGRGVFLYEEDYLLARFVKEGDRVRIKKSRVSVLGMKPSDLMTGTVRYVGQLDEEGTEHMLFVGLHMDDAVGDTNGIIDDKRYFYSKKRHGKMVRITEVLYLLNPKTTSFDKISDLVEEYKASRRKRWREYPEEGPRLIRVT